MLEEHGLGGVMWCMVLEEHGEVVCGECECMWWWWCMVLDERHRGFIVE
jgi:hypothetical protein